MPAPIFTPSEETLALEVLISEKKANEYVTYEEVTTKIGIDLKEASGRSKFYTACRRLKREFLNSENYGYKMSAPETSTVIVDKKVRRIVGAAKNTTKSVGNLRREHDGKLSKCQIERLDCAEFGSLAIQGKAQEIRVETRKAYQLPDVIPIV